MRAIIRDILDPVLGYNAHLDIAGIMPLGNVCPFALPINKELKENVSAKKDMKDSLILMYACQHVLKIKSELQLPASVKLETFELMAFAHPVHHILNMLMVSVFATMVNCPTMENVRNIPVLIKIKFGIRF